ncbi:hypothetical protein K0M31_012200, partial [Melipona bicolor]
GVDSPRFSTRGRAFEALLEYNQRPGHVRGLLDRSNKGLLTGRWLHNLAIAWKLQPPPLMIITESKMRL